MQTIDAQEYAYWKAVYLRNGGFGEDKVDRIAAYTLLLLARIAGNSKVSYDDALAAINPSTKRQETTAERRARVRGFFQQFAMLPMKAPPKG